MNRILIVLLFTCVLTSAMVPRDRRALDKEDVTFCASKTPCAWAFLDPNTRLIQLYAPSSYCICQQGELCLNEKTENDVNFYVYLCKSENSQNNTDTPES